MIKHHPVHTKADNFYSHKYQQLPLVPTEDFLQQHPEHVHDDENSLMIARINHEHAEREALEQARQGLLKKKQGLIADNKKRKDDLASLDKDLEKFIDVSLVNCFHPQYVEGLKLILLRPLNLFKKSLKKTIEATSVNEYKTHPGRSIFNVGEKGISYYLVHSTLLLLWLGLQIQSNHLFAHIKVCILIKSISSPFRGKIFSFHIR